MILYPNETEGETWHFQASMNYLHIGPQGLIQHPSPFVRVGILNLKNSCGEKPL